jgi:hypothetical protein
MDCSGSEARFFLAVTDIPVGTDAITGGAPGTSMTTWDTCRNSFVPNLASRTHGFNYNEYGVISAMSAATGGHALHVTGTAGRLQEFQFISIYEQETAEIFLPYALPASNITRIFTLLSSAEDTR